MAILDKVLGVGEAVRDKLKETFGEPDVSRLDDDGAGDGDGDVPEGEPALDVAGAWAALGLAEGATLADVREAYRSISKWHHPIAVRDGADSDAQKALDRCLEALELLEETLVPLSGAAPAKGPSSPPPPSRKRATARAK